jgi:hypothetical protein
MYIDIGIFITESRHVTKLDSPQESPEHGRYCVLSMLHEHRFIHNISIPLVTFT